MERNTRALVETGLLTTIIIVCILMGMYIPLLGFLGSLVAPATLAVIGVRWGSSYSLASATVAFLLLAMFMGPIMAVSYMVSYGLVGICIGEAYHSAWAPWKQMTISAGAFLFGIATVAAISMYISGVNPATLAQQVHDEMVQNLNLANAYMDENSIDKSAALAAFEQQWNYLVHQGISLLVVVSVVFTYFISKVTEILLRRLNLAFNPLPGMARWRTGLWAPYILGLGLCTAYLGPRYGYEWVGLVGANLAMIGGFFCGIHGLGTVWSFVETRQLSRTVSTIILVLLVLFFTQGLALLGIFDMIFNWRDRYRM